MPKKVIIATLDKERCVDIEDSGCAVIVNCDDAVEVVPDDEGMFEGMFVRLHSWSEKKAHDEITQFIGKRVKITIETLD